MIRFLSQSRALPWATGGTLFALVVAWTLLVTPRYRSVALLQVERERPAAGLADAVSAMPGGALLGLSQDDLETQIGVLTSRRVLDAVLDTLGLMVTVEDAGVPRTELLRARVVDRSARSVEGELEFRREGDRWTYASTEWSDREALRGSVASGEPITVGGVELVVAPSREASDVRAFTMVVVPRYVARRAVQERLEVRRQSAAAKLITLAYDDPDPALAAMVLERILAEYLDFTARSARGDAGTTAAELRRQIAAQEERLRAAEEDLRRYQQQTGLVIPEEQGAAQVQRYATLRGALDALEVEREALSRLLALVDIRARERGAGEEPSTEAYRQLATFPSLITNRAIQDLLLTLTSLENDRSELRVARSDDNADVRRLTQRIEEVEGQLQRLGRQYLESLDEQIAPTRAALAGLDAELAALPERELRFIRLLRERSILTEGYLLLQKQLRQTELQDALRLDDVRIVDAPSVPHPDDPYFPRPLVNLVLALVLGFTGGGAVAALQAALREPATTSV